MRQQEAKSHKLKNEVEGLLTNRIKVSNGESLFLKIFCCDAAKIAGTSVKSVSSLAGNRCNACY